ncbi:MAG TPA: tripartite tricarboxylate transporter substrate binding protein [Burkholderiales bacterium]|nr:tripartite tricarboxylate transporter substrate binding protein [Burkholderiales bacterium]
MVRILAGITLALAVLPVSAQTWPHRPVKFIVSLGPGSGADIGARLFADRLTQRWGQPVVIENRPGGDGVVAINAVLSAKDDHVLLWGPSSNFVGHPYTLEKLPYNKDDMLPVARVTNTVVTLAVPPSLGVNSLKEFVALARQQPGKLNFASVTTVTDIIMAGYFKSAGLDVQKVSYKDTVTALNDLMEGRIQMYGAAYAIVRSQAQAGRVKVLAITNRSRVPGLDVPTVSELGFPQLNFDGLVGLIASRSSGISDAARERIAADIKAVAADPVIAERLAATAQVNAPGTGADLAASIEEQAAQLAATAKILGMKPNF